MTDAAAVRDALVQNRFRFSSESELQDGIAQALTAAGIQFKREAIVQGGRIDFLCQDAVGIEVKVDGSMAKLARQIHAYLADERIHELLVVTSRCGHLGIPNLLKQKKVVLLWLSERAL